MNLTKFISFKNRQPSNVGNQNSDDTKEICEYISSRITPQEGSTPKNETLFIVNSAEFAQQVVIETCKL